MVASLPDRWPPKVLALTVALATAAALAAPPLAEPRVAGSTPTGATRDQAVSLDAASSDVDYRTNTVNFRDVVVTQGTTRVTADTARATGLNFENATWNFSGNVRISVDGGSLRSNQAVVDFARNRITRATITGSPAEFEQKRADSADIARGRASRIEYDVPAGTVTLSGEAWLTDGRNEISGSELVYSVREQRVQAQAQPGDAGRVRITIRPRPDESAP